jgi:hypothetical protein
MIKETCHANSRAGVPCRAKVAAHGLCAIHSDPGRAAELGRMSGESRRRVEGDSVALPDPRTAHDVHEALGRVFLEVAAGNISVKVGTSLAYIASVLLKTIEVSEHEVLLRGIEAMISRRSDNDE